MDSKPSKKDKILQHLVILLESSDHQRITTALLAKETGVSEAALYKHFPSKTRMFEDLIDFIENTLFVRINHILQEEHDYLLQLEKIMKLLLLFAEKNPGLCKILTREALVNEHQRLQARIDKLFNRLETQIKQVLKELEVATQIKLVLLKTNIAKLCINLFDGRISQYARTGFAVKPTDEWETLWDFLKSQLFIKYV